MELLVNSLKTPLFSSGPEHSRYGEDGGGGVFSLDDQRLPRSLPQPQKKEPGRLQGEKGQMTPCRSCSRDDFNARKEQGFSHKRHAALGWDLLLKILKTQLGKDWSDLSWLCSERYFDHDSGPLKDLPT